VFHDGPLAMNYKNRPESTEFSGKTAETCADSAQAHSVISITKDVVISDEVFRMP
jgi:hypothetical protein